jgi:hypothetical protein
MMYGVETPNWQAYKSYFTPLAMVLTLRATAVAFCLTLLVHWAL